MGLLYLENNLTTNAFTPDRLEVLSILASQAAISLTNSRLVAEETERQKLQKEMEMAKSVQMSILPQETQDESYNIAAHMTPAEQVGGDYYDYVQRHYHNSRNGQDDDNYDPYGFDDDDSFDDFEQPQDANPPEAAK